CCSHHLAQMDTSSLATFCVLLKYLYTKDLDFAVDPTQYLMCDMDHLRDETSMDLTSALAVLNKTLEEHNAAKFYAIWNIKDKVTSSSLQIDSRLLTCASSVSRVCS
ncbi:hypothetical protein BGZ65_005247, partial [Modicella reniformis]